jgi:nucleotide-binding universal stress UspA family protein
MDVARQARHTQEALVRAVVARFPGPLPELVTELVQADPASALIDRSRDGLLLVLGSQGLTSASDTAVGSVADACLRHGGCPVVVIPAEPAATIPAPMRAEHADLGRADSRRPGLAPSVLGALGLM